MKNLFFRFLATASLALLVAACATGPTDRYPEFEQRRQSIGTIGILLDMALLDDISGDVDKIDVKKNRDLGKEVLDMLWSELNLKGYAVKDGIVASVGLTLLPPPSTNGATNENAPPQLKVAGTEPGVRVQEDADLPAGLPPYFIDTRIAKNKDAEASIHAVYAMLPNVKREKEQPNVMVPTVAQLDKLMATDLYLVASVRGRSVGAAKQIGNAILTGVLSLGLTGGAGFISVWGTSFCAIDLVLVDARTGEAVWDDHSFIKGGKDYEDKLPKITKKILAQIPEKSARMTKQ